MDFSQAEYTAIVSDMHLCEAEPVNLKFPLWKKFKTRAFFFDDVFEQFLAYLEKRADGKPIELILNGDIFDFDSVTSHPAEPSFHISWLEESRGLFPRPERAKYKIEVILKDHEQLVRALGNFIQRGHRAVFVIGNHDLEMHFPEVQEEIIRALSLTPEAMGRVRFSEWFYISNKDTLIEHGNQYDPYCVCEDPISPFVQGYNFKAIRLPFGNLACRYILNGMGFFNPHVDANYIMSLPEYIRFFVKYMLRAQPLLVWTWFWGAVMTLWQSFLDRFHTVVRDPFKIEDKINKIAQHSNATPRIVREMKELFASPANNNPILLARELWLDRAFLIFISFIIIFEMMLVVRQIYSVSFFWAFIPLFLLVPFFLFYSKSIVSHVSSYKEPDDWVLSTSSAITGVSRIVYGHTHVIRHEMIGSVEHLNSGCWSPAFLDVECTKSVDQKTFVWIQPSDDPKFTGRSAQLMVFDGEKTYEAFKAKERSKAR